MEGKMEIVWSDGELDQEFEVIGREAVDLVYMVHFGEKEPTKARCRDCADFRQRECAGKDKKGMACYDCMAEKVLKGL